MSSLPGPAGDLPHPVAAVCAAWLDLADAAVPGLVTGLHVRGGLGFGEWVPGASDVDVVAVLDRRPSDAEVDLLGETHEALAADHPEIPFDGIHVTAADLAGDPESCPEVPCVLHGWFEPAGRWDVTPVGWHELAWHSVPVRGALPAVWTDRARLEAFTREHLTVHWVEQAAALEKFPAEAATEAATWHVLGVARLHHLLETGAMTSKSAGGRWALGFHDPRWHPLLREALRVRGATPEDRALPPSYEGPGGAERRGADVAAFVADVVSSA